MHGMFSGAESMTQLVGYIKNAHPGTEVYSVDAYNDLVRQMLQVFTLSIELFLRDIVTLENVKKN